MYPNYPLALRLDKLVHLNNLIFFRQRDFYKKTFLWKDISRDANLAKRFVVFLGLKESILYEKNVFSPVVQYTCVVINLEKKQYFPKSCSIFEVFSSKNSTKYCKKGTLGISALGLIGKNWLSAACFIAGLFNWKTFF